MWLRLDGTGPLHRQTYRGLRRAILEGELEPGAKLPSTRALAAEAGISRNTVLQAYEQLVAEGYAVGRRGSGTYVFVRFETGSCTNAIFSTWACVVFNCFAYRVTNFGGSGRSCPSAWRASISDSVALTLAARFASVGCEFQKA